MTTSVFDANWQDASPTLDEVFGATVTYTRGAASVDVVALACDRDYELVRGDGYVELFRCRDFLLTIADLVLGSAAAVPGRGDTITETLGGVARTYTVVSLGDRPACEIQPGGQKYLVHAKETAAA